MHTDHVASTTNSSRAITRTIGLAVLTAVIWGGWLGWDTQKDVDPVTGTASGPYQVWQIVGCVCSLAVVAVVAASLVPPWLVPPTMTLAFTACWTWQAATGDDSGLWAVGAVLVFFATAVGSIMATTVGWLLRHRRS
jgi:hypothetical protein